MKVRKYFFSIESGLLVSGVLLYLIACLINTKNHKPTLELSKQDTALNVDSNLILYLSAGNKRLLTDLIWVQTLIESDLERYNKKDLNNWLFLRFKTISILDPKFYENYLYGGQFLAIIKDDLEGADILYRKGIEHFSDDFNLNYNAGFLNYYEMQNPIEGIKFLAKVEDHPRAPLFLKSIINKLKLESGEDISVIYDLVRINYETTKDETLKRRLRSDLYAIKAEIDLKCLNDKLKNCSMTDLEGNNYVLKDGKYTTIQGFSPFRIKRRKTQ